MRWAINLALLLSTLASCHQIDTPTGIRFVGLEHSSCDGTTLLFGTVTLLAVAEGPGEFSSVTFMIDGMEQIIDNESPFEYAFEPLDEGTLKIGATGIDSDGETKSTSVEVCVDNNGPKLTIKRPPERITVEDHELAITVEDAKDGRPVQRVTASLVIAGVHQEVECTPLEQPICRLSPREMGVVLAPGQEVEGTLTVTARDSAGHETVVTNNPTVGTHLIWKTYIGGNLAWEPLMLPGEILAVGTTNAFIRLMNLSGKELCTFQVPDTSTTQPGVVYKELKQIVTPLVSNAAGTRLFFGTKKAMWALDIGLGGISCTLRWRRELLMPAGTPDARNQEYHEDSRFAFSEQFNALFIALYDGDASPVLLNAIDADTSAVLGQLAVGEELGGATDVPTALSPVISDDGDTLYVGRRGMYAIDVTPLFSDEGGEMTYRGAFVAPDTNFTAAPLQVGSLLYAAAWDGKVYALRTPDLSEVVGFNFEQVKGQFTSAVVASEDGQTLFAANGDNANLYAFGAFTGASRGEINLGKAPTAAPVVGPGNMIYLSTIYPAEQTQLSAVALPQMALRWAFAPTGHDAFQGAPVIHKNTLYVGNNNGFLYALDVSVDDS